MTQCGKLLGGGRRDAQRPGASRCSTPPPGTRQNRQNLVLAIWSVTWAAAGLGAEPTRGFLSVMRAPHPVAHRGAAKRSQSGHVVRRTASNVLGAPTKP